MLLTLLPELRVPKLKLVIIFVFKLILTYQLWFNIFHQDPARTIDFGKDYGLDYGDGIGGNISRTHGESRSFGAEFGQFLQQGKS